MTGDDGLSDLPPERRAFLKRLAMGAAVVVPIVTSFQLGGTRPAHASNGDSSNGNGSTGGDDVDVWIDEDPVNIASATGDPSDPAVTTTTTTTPVPTTPPPTTPPPTTTVPGLRHLWD